MIIEQTSVSQVTSYDPAQEGGCPRRFWFERVNDLKPEQDNAQSEGSKGHALFAAWFATGQMPAKRVKMGKHVTAAILKGELPKPGGDLLVEERFDGQPMWRPVVDDEGQPVLDDDGEPKREWVPLDKANTYWLAGIPWDGAIDLAYRRGPRPVILDLKFGSDPDANAKRNDQLIKTVQMPIYVHSQMPYWPDAREYEIQHYNIKRSGIHSFMRRAVVTVDQVLERTAQIADLVEEMKGVALATSQDDVPFNRRSCHSWLGCPHQSICNAFKRNQMNFSAEDQDLFNELEGVSVDAAPPAAAPSLQVADTKAAKAARLRAELAAMDAEEAPAPPSKPVDTGPAVPAPRARRVPIVNEPMGNCAPCGTALDAGNASKLTDGRIVHIGCSAAAAPVVPPDAPASKPELASEQPAAPKVPKPRAPKPPPAPLTPPIADQCLLGPMVQIAPSVGAAPKPAITITLAFGSPEAAAAFLSKLS